MCQSNVPFSLDRIPWGDENDDIGYVHVVDHSISCMIQVCADIEDDSQESRYDDVDNATGENDDKVGSILPWQGNE